MHREPRLGQQRAQLVGPLEGAYGVEAPVQDAVAGLKLGEQPLQRIRRLSRLLGQVRRLRRKQLPAEPFQAGRVLAHQELHLEVAGVQGTGEGPDLGLVQLQAQHLADAQLHPVQAHRPVVLQV